MRLTMRVRTALGVFAAAIAFVALASAQGAQRPGPATPLVDMENLRMGADQEPGSRGLAVVGDPSKAGIYVARYRYAPGALNPPHFHDQDRYVTVIKGTWWTGTGTVVEPDSMVPIRAGGFMFHPAGLRHYDGARDEETIVQVIGMGPVTTTMLDAPRQPGATDPASRGGRRQEQE